MPLTTKTLPLAGALLCGLLSAAAYPDVAEVLVDNGQVMTFEYDDARLRITLPGEDKGYMLLRDDSMYVVTEQNGQTMVLDLSSAVAMFGQLAANAAPDAAGSKVLSLEETGRAESLGGIEGEVYRLQFVGPDGSERETEMVLSKDPLALGFRDAVERMATTIAGAVDPSRFQNELKAGEDMQQKLRALGMGVLRYGDDMRVRSLTATEVAAERFELPAPPTDLGSMIRQALGESAAGKR